MDQFEIENEIFLKVEGELELTRKGLESKACDAIKALLEDKFLYQNVKINAEECQQMFSKRLKQNEFKERFEDVTRKFRDSSLEFGFKTEQGFNCLISHGVHPPETVNTTCERCKSVTPHNPQRYQCFDGFLGDRGYDETIALQMQCQKCKRGCLTVLIRREGLRLQLVGRSQVDRYAADIEMQYVKDDTRIISFFEDAMMAERTGSHIAAICLLRVAIEQYMRSIVHGEKLRLTGDALYEKFDATLPNDFPRDRVANLNTVYGRLSEVMHDPSSYKEGEFMTLFDKVRVFMSFVKLMPPVAPDGIS